MATKTAVASNARRTTELLIVTPDTTGTFMRIATPLAKKKINIECFTGYGWGAEAAFRIVTDDNPKAAELLRREGFPVQELPVVLWSAANAPGQLLAATAALVKAGVNTHCAYASTLSHSKNCTIAFNTNNPDTTVKVLSRLR